jgi:hypothetical protein
MAVAQDRPTPTPQGAPVSSLPSEHSAAESELDVIERTRRIVLNHIRALPNFICRRISRQFYDRSGVGAKWRLVQTVVAEVRYVDGRESFRTLSVNGKSSSEEFRSVSGTYGAFASTLNNIFSPEANAKLWLSGDSALNRRPVHVVRMSVPTPLGSHVIHLGLDRNGKKIRPIDVGYQGLVLIAKDSGSVLRIHAQETLGISDEYPIEQAEFSVDYGDVRIGTSVYSLPVRKQGLVYVRRGGVTKHEVEFLDYRKFDAESTLTFQCREPRLFGITAHTNLQTRTRKGR